MKKQTTKVMAAEIRNALTMPRLAGTSGDGATSVRDAPHLRQTSKRLSLPAPQTGQIFARSKDMAKTSFLLVC